MMSRPHICDNTLTGPGEHGLVHGQVTNIMLGAEGQMLPKAHPHHGCTYPNVCLHTPPAFTMLNHTPMSTCLSGQLLFTLADPIWPQLSEFSVWSPPSQADRQGEGH